MSKSQVIAILFDDNSGNLIFHTGQLVTGHVHVQTTERIKIRGIRLRVTGNGDTSWREGPDDDKKTYKGHEEYMNLEINLLGSRDNDSELYLEPSVVKYPFSFILPAELPQTFGDTVGHIRYMAKATIDRPMKFDDEADVQFAVIHLLDLNREPPRLREPLVIHSETKAIGCFCVNGFADIRATLNKGGFVPGETIRVEGEIANRTNTTIKKSTITLFQRMIYYDSKGKTKRAATTLAKFERPFIPSGQTDSWDNILFVVPQVVASRLDGCGIIDIKYCIEISAIFHQCCSSSSVSNEIVIGNIPLRDDFQPYVVTSQPVAFPMPFTTPGDYSVDEKNPVP